MGISKVVYGDRTLVDLTDSTVTPETMIKGVTAINSAGEKITGTVNIPNCYFITNTGSIPVGTMTMV